MANLFWKTKQTTKNLLVTPFKTEEEFERIVFETPGILEDIFFIKRQIRGGNKPGIPDIIGIDTDGNICIIEMKNVTVDASIIPQVLQYAFWAERNPDSIKSLWLECNNKPEDVSISWDDCQVRIIVVAPTILQSTLDLVDKINYQVDLFEVNRWVEGDNQLLLVKKLEQEEKRNKPLPVRGMPVYDEEYYKKNYNIESAKHFIRYTNELEEIVKRKQWPLEMKFNKSYCGFKAGYFIVFGIEWVGSKTFAFFAKVSETEAMNFKIPMTKYLSQWKQADYYIDPKMTKTNDFIDIFEKAYKQRIGE